MAKTLLQAAVPAWVVNDGVTQFAPVGNMRLGFDSAEIEAQIRYRFAGTVSNLHVRIGANSLTNSATITLRLNGVDTALVATITAGSTGEFVNDADSVAVASGDFLSFKITSAAGGTSISVDSISVTMDAAVDRKVVVGGLPFASNISTASATRYVHLVSGDLVNTTEAVAQDMILQTCTARNAYLYVLSNGRSTSTVFTLRKNGVDTGLTITVGAGATGAFEDTTNSVALVDGDLVGWQIVTGTGTGTLALRAISVQIDSTTQYQTFSGRDSDEQLDTGDFSSAGGYFFVLTTETRVKVKVRATESVGKLALYVRTNSGTITGTLRKNGVDTAAVVSVPSTATGWHEGATSADFTEGDDLSVGWAASAANSCRSMTMLMGTTAGAGSLIPSRSHHQPRFYNRRKVA